MHSLSKLEHVTIYTSNSHSHLPHLDCFRHSQLTRTFFFPYWLQTQHQCPYQQNAIKELRSDWELQPWCKTKSSWLQRSSSFIIPFKFPFNNRCTLIIVFLNLVNKRSFWLYISFSWILLAQVHPQVSHIFSYAGKLESLTLLRGSP